MASIFRAFLERLGAQSAGTFVGAIVDGMAQTGTGIFS